MKAGTIRLEQPFALLAISSHENDYRLSWSLNQDLSVQLKQSGHFRIHHPKYNAEMEFSKFIHEDEETLTKLCLVSNRCQDGFLLSEQKTIDFLLKITSEEEKVDQLAMSLLKKIKENALVHLAYVIDQENLKPMYLKLIQGL